MNDPTKSVVDDFLALDEKRTPGEWEHPGEFVDNPLDSNRVFASGRDGSILETHGDSYEAIANAAFCAAASRLAPELRSLTGEVERLRAEVKYNAEGWNKSAMEGNAQVADLRAQLAACQQDARRYRWLRQTGGKFTYPNGRKIDLMTEWNDDVLAPNDELDAAIDAALSGAKDNG